MKRASAFITITIPRMEEQVKETPLVAPRRGNQIDVTAGLAKGLESAAFDVQRAFHKEAAEQDASRAQLAIAEYENAETRFKYGGTGPDGKTRIPGLFESVGEAAVNPPDGVTLDKKAEDWNQKYLDELLPKLGNERQRELVRNQILKSRSSLVGSALLHESNEGKKVKIGNAIRATDTSTDTAITVGANPNASPEEVTSAITSLKTAVHTQSILEGYGPDSDYTKGVMAEKISKVHSGIIQAKMNADDDDGAIAYWKKHSAEITDAATRNAIEPHIQKLEIIKVANDKATSVWNEKRPQDINGVLDIASMRGAIRSDTSLSSEEKERAEKRVESLANEYLQEKRFNEEGASNKYYAMPTQGATFSQVVRAITLDSTIDQGAKDRLIDWAEHKYKIDEARAEARADAREAKREAKADAKYARELQTMANRLQFQTDYASGKIPKMSPKEVAKYVSTFGKQTDNVMAFVQAANTEGVNAQTSIEGIGRELRVMKANKAFENFPIPDPDSSDADEKGKIAILQKRVMERIAASAKAGPGKQMTVQQALAEEVKPVMQRRKTFGKPLVRPNYLLGTTYVDSEPKDWPAEAQTEFVRSNYFRKTGVYPSPAETLRLRKQLTK